MSCRVVGLECLSLLDICRSLLDVERLSLHRYNGSRAENTTDLYLGEHSVAQGIVRSVSFDAIYYQNINLTLFSLVTMHAAGSRRPSSPLREAL